MECYFEPMEVQKRIIAIVVSVVFMYVGLVAAFTMSHEGSMMGMADCPFMAQSNSLCAMGAADHIAFFQNLANVPLASLLLILVLTIVAAALVFVLRPLFVADLSPGLRQRLRTVNPQLVFANNFSRLFSDGILHSKSW